MSDCNFSRLITMYETGGLDNAMKTHLHNCPNCQKRMYNFLAFSGAMVLENSGSTEEITTLPDVSLPDRLRKKVEERKKQWLEQQLGNVMEFKNIKKKQDQQTILDRLMGEQPVDLPKAAFPDDLEDEDDS